MINKGCMKIAFTYIGAIVGAGFATGQEIYQFFTVFKLKGIIGAVLSTIGFVLFAIMYLDIIYKMPINSYNDLLKLLVGKKIAKIFDISISAFLFASFTIMLAAAFSLVNNHLINSPLVSHIIVISITWFSLKSGIKGIIKINTYLIPILVGVIVTLCIINLTGSLESMTINSFVPKNYIFSSITYVSYNLIIGMVVLSSLKGEIYTKKNIIIAPIISGLIMGLMLVLITIATSTLRNPSSIPILDLAIGADKFLYGTLLLGIGVAIVTSALASGYGLINRINQTFSLRYSYIVLIITATAVPLSLYGFEDLIKFVYPIFGLVNLIIMAMTIKFYILHRIKGFYIHKK